MTRNSADGALKSTGLPDRGWTHLQGANIDVPKSARRNQADPPPALTDAADLWHLVF
jgi:hypothetical protein